MKKFTIALLILVLTVSMLTGCGCTRRDAVPSTKPITTEPMIPTNIPETTVPTETATEPVSVAPTEETVIPDMTDGENGTTSGTDSTEDVTRSRMR